MAKAKTTGKSTAAVGELIPQPHGGALRNGGTNRGGSGRPTNAFKDFLARLRADPDARQALERAAKDEKGRNFSSAWKIAAEYDDEKPAEKHKIVGPVEVVVRVAREGRRITAS